MHVSTHRTQIQYDPCTLILIFPYTILIEFIFFSTHTVFCLSKQWRQTWFEYKEEDGGQCRFISTVASDHVATQAPYVTPCRGREEATTLFYSLALCTSSSHDTHSNLDGFYISRSRFLSVIHTEWKQRQCSLFCKVRSSLVFSRTLRENSRFEELNTCWFFNNVSVFYKNIIDIYQIISHGECKKSY